MSIKPVGRPVHRFGDFPKGLWWLRWVDHVRTVSGVTSTSSVEVLLSRLPEDTSEQDLPMLDADLLRLPSTHEVRRLHVGWLPSLALGSLYRDGVALGRCLPAMEREFLFERPGADDSLVKKLRPGGKVPDWWFDEGAAVDRGVFPIPGFDDSHCLQLRDSEKRLLIPCSEVTRTMFARSRCIALALFAGQWDRCWHRAANPEATGFTSDGGWQVCLRSGVASEQAAILANLILNPAGRREANKIYHGLLTPDRQTPGLLKAGLPFDWQRLKIRASGIALSGQSDRMLGLRILSMRMPGPPGGPPKVVRWTTDADREAVRGGRMASGDRGQRISRERFSPDPAGLVDATSGEDPSSYSKPLRLRVEGSTWLDAPVMLRVAPTSKEAGDKIQRFVQDVPASEVSAGNEAPGLSGVVAADVESRAAYGSQFDRVLSMLDTLVVEGLIDSHEPVVPPPADAGRRADLVTWNFPPPERTYPIRRSWCELETSPERVRRTAMVRRVTCWAGVAYWFEIELRESEGGYRSLLFLTEEQSLTPTIQGLLEVVNKAKGVWPPLDEVVSAAGLDGAALWSHHGIEEGYGRKRASDAISHLLLSE